MIDRIIASLLALSSLWLFSLRAAPYSQTSVIFAPQGFSDLTLDYRFRNGYSPHAIDLTLTTTNTLSVNETSLRTLYLYCPQGKIWFCAVGMDGGCRVFQFTGNRPEHTITHADLLGSVVGVIGCRFSLSPQIQPFLQIEVGQPLFSLNGWEKSGCHSFSFSAGCCF